MSFKSILQKIKLTIRKILGKIEEEAETMLPYAINAANVLKKIGDSPIDDIAFFVAKQVFPAGPVTAVQVEFNLILSKLPDIIAKLAMAKDLLAIEDPSQRALQMVAAIPFSSDAAKNNFAHSIAAELILAASDGKISLGEAFQIGEDIYQEMKRNGTLI